MWLSKMGNGKWLMAVLIGASLLTQGCSKDEEDGYDPFVQLDEDIATIRGYLDDNNIDADIDSTSGIFISIHKQGGGYKTISGIEVTTNFQGWTLDGVEFVNNFTGNPVTARLGDPSSYSEGHTSGVTIGLSLMQQADSATIYVPSPYGFQNTQYKDVSPNSILVYNLKFESIPTLNEDYEKIDQYILDNNMASEIEPNYGIRYVIHRPGNNIEPRSGAVITTHYQGELLDGSIFDASYDSGVPLTFNYGDGQLIVGFEMGVSQLHENDSATIFIPAIYGYGNQTRDGIPANSVLLFGLDILRISNPN